MGEDRAREWGSELIGPLSHRGTEETLDTPTIEELEAFLSLLAQYLEVANHE